MSDTGPENIAVEPPRRHRWLRRELWFVVAAVVIVFAVVLAYRHHPPTHVAPGAPLGGVPTGAAAVPVARPSPAPTPGG